MDKITKFAYFGVFSGNVFTLVAILFYGRANHLAPLSIMAIYLCASLLSATGFYFKFIKPRIENGSKTLSTTANELRPEGGPPKTKPRTKTFLIPAFIIIGLYILFSILLAVPIQQRRALANAEQGWKETNAEIISSDVEAVGLRGRVSWYPFWFYSYSVNGHQYRGDSRTFTTGYEKRWLDSADAARQSATSRSNGTTVSAFYDPEVPAHSVLDRHESSWREFRIELEIAKIFGVILLLYAVLVRVLRKKRNSD
ncbi:DUF3592 domain-containing protein [Caballeronia sp. SBC2]|uniref:DUF3592 domain-containing protein n=1 Tax=Caballeronia sp. SBC2 TaxID=2705547 RepID=UPI0013E16A50|nr:DUF3592 domain-containing protein [Caballeronia sp. SBC2]QIE22252.1 hypothetical protein SBC2_02610 [Caballeronia sp. SBC2]